MAGTLTISTLSDGTNSTSSTNCIQGSAKAWVNFNGVTTATIRGSFNVSSVTRNGTGDYTVSYTTAMPNANYVVSGSAQYETGGYNEPRTMGPRSVADMVVGSVRVQTGYTSYYANDCTIVNVAILSA